jgi:hypothetical protein
MTRIPFNMPAAGEKPSEFRRALISAIRDAIAAAHFAGDVDSARAEESFRALVVEDPHP